MADLVVTGRHSQEPDTRMAICWVMWTRRCYQPSDHVTGGRVPCHRHLGKLHILVLGDGVMSSIAIMT